MLHEDTHGAILKMGIGGPVTNPKQKKPYIVPGWSCECRLVVTTSDSLAQCSLSICH